MPRPKRAKIAPPTQLSRNRETGERDGLSRTDNNTLTRGPTTIPVNPNPHTKVFAGRSPGSNKRKRGESFPAEDRSRASSVEDRLEHSSFALKQQRSDNGMLAETFQLLRSRHDRSSTARQSSIAPTGELGADLIPAPQSGSLSSASEDLEDADHDSAIDDCDDIDEDRPDAGTSHSPLGTSPISASSHSSQEVVRPLHASRAQPQPSHSRISTSQRPTSTRHQLRNPPASRATNTNSQGIQSLTTARLQQLLPKRRRHRDDDNDDDSEESLNTRRRKTYLDDGEDKAASTFSRPSVKPRKDLSKQLASRAAGLERTELSKEKTNAASQARNYGNTARSNTENEPPIESSEDEEVVRSKQAEVRPLEKVIQRKEVQKFKDVDGWDLDFEEVSMSSSGLWE